MFFRQTYIHTTYIIVYNELFEDNFAINVKRWLFWEVLLIVEEIVIVLTQSLTVWLKVEKYNHHNRYITQADITVHMDHRPLNSSAQESTSSKDDIGTDEWRVYNVLQLNSSLLSAQSRRPSQRVHSGLHSPEPQRNCVSASQAGHTHNINSLDTCLAHHVPALVHCHVLAQCTFLHAAMYSAWLRVQHWLTEPRD